MRHGRAATWHGWAAVAALPWRARQVPMPGHTAEPGIAVAGCRSGPSRS